MYIRVSRTYHLQSLKFQITSLIVECSVGNLFIYFFAEISYFFSIHLIPFYRHYTAAPPLSILFPPPNSFKYRWKQTSVFWLPGFIVLVNSARKEEMCWIQTFVLFGFKKTRVCVFVCVYVCVLEGGGRDRHCVNTVLLTIILSW